MQKVTVLQASHMPPEGESSQRTKHAARCTRSCIWTHTSEHKEAFETHAPTALPSLTAWIFFASFVSSQVGNGYIKQVAHKAGKRNLKNKTPCTANSKVPVAAAEVGFYSTLLHHIFPPPPFFFNAKVLHALRSNCPITGTPSKARKNKKA